MQRTIVGVLVLLLSALLIPAVFAQEPAAESESLWLEPINLSESGGATDPQFVIASDGTYHALWRDEFVGFVYTSGSGEQWAAPVSAETPFIERRYLEGTNRLTNIFYHRPQLIADRVGNIHAFWLNDNSTLLHSFVSAESFTIPAAWSTISTLAARALTWDAVLDADGTIHLAYVNPRDGDVKPAGVYHRKTASIGETVIFSADNFLQASRYFRSTPASAAHIQIAASGADIYIAWDDPLPEKLYFASSNDAGNTWRTAAEVDQRQTDDSIDAVRPSKVAVSVVGDAVHFIWLAGHEGALCNIQHRWTANGGITWEQGIVPNEFGDCPRQTLLLGAEDGTQWLQLVADDTGYLQVWDGTAWSPPQEDAELRTFVDPNRFRPILFDCLESQLVDNTLTVIGCDKLVINGQPDEVLDIWLMRRPLESPSSLFVEPPAPVWSAPELVAVTDDSAGQATTVTDDAGRLHSFWTGALSEDGGSMTIFYSRFDDSRWSPPITIIQTDLDNISQPNVVIGANDRLHVVWQGGTLGEIYYSSADTNTATAPDDWAEPREISAETTGGESPSIAVRADGQLLVAYSVSINEQRGVYLTTSENSGVNWLEPTQLFSGAAADWAQVGNAQIGSMDDGSLHLLVTKYSAGVSVGLYYLFSADQGATWDEAEVVAATAVTASRLFVASDQTIHRIWLDESSAPPTLQHQYSLNNGASWSRIERVPSLTIDATLFDINLDSAGRLHVLNLTAAHELQHSAWQAGTWQPLDAATLMLDAEDATLADVQVLAAGLAGQGDLLYLFAGSAESELTENNLRGIYFGRRTLTYDAAQLAAFEAPVSRSEPTLESTLSVTDQTATQAESSEAAATSAAPEPSTVEFSTEPNRGPFVPGLGFIFEGEWALVGLAVFPVVLIVVLVGFIVWRARASSR